MALQPAIHFVDLDQQRSFAFLYRGVVQRPAVHTSGHTSIVKMQRRTSWGVPYVSESVSRADELRLQTAIQRNRRNLRSQRRVSRSHGLRVEPDRRTPTRLQFLAARGLRGNAQLASSGNGIL